VAALRRAVLPYFSYTAIRIEAVDPFVLYQDASEHYPLLQAIKTNDTESARRIFTEKIKSWLALARVEISRGGR